MKDGLLKFKMYKSFWFSALINFAMFLIASWLLPIRYEELDDTTQLLFASGAYTGTPDAHLVFLNYIYGMFVTFLYNNIGGVEWYTVCFAIIHIISLSIITWRIFNTKMHRAWKICGILILYLLEFYFIHNFQFTTTAALCATAAIILLIKGSRIQQYCAVGIFTLAAFVRFDSAFLVLAVCSPALLFYILKQQKKIATLFPLILFALIPFVGSVVDRKIYEKDADWKAYREYNYYRGAISDNPNAIKMNAYPTFVDSTDFMLFRGVFPDISVVNNEKAKQIYDYVKDVSLVDKLGNVYIRDKYPINLRTHRTALIAFCVITIFLIVFLEDRKMKYLVGGTTLMLLLLFSYICLEGMIKDRVFYSAILPYAFILLYVFTNLKREVIVRCGIALFVGMVVFLGIDLVKKRKNKNNSFETRAAETIDILKQAKPLLGDDEILIAYLNAITIEALPPYSLSEFYKNNRYTIINWTSTIPFNKGRMDSFLDIVDKNVIVASEWDVEHNLPIIQQNILVNHGIQTVVESVAKSGGIHLIRITSVQSSVESETVSDY